MTTKRILTLTLLATTLAFGSALPRETTRTTQQKSNSVSTKIARTLIQRGIDDDKAFEIAQNFTMKNEELLSIMISNYLNSTSIKQDALYKELSKIALVKKKADFTSYAFLLKLTQNLEKQQPDAQKLKLLSSISTNNSLLEKVFS